jgi:UDP-glucuronate 4-epimerase
MPETVPKSQRVLVTGAAGFIGFHTVSRLLAAGVTVHGLDNLNAYYDVGLKRARLAQIGTDERFAFSHLDVTDYEGLRALWANFRPDCVVHLAAQAGVRHSLDHPREYVSTNLDGFLGVLEACRAHPVRHLVYASSSSVYGANSKVPFHEDDRVPAPVSLYGATKRANELMAQTYAHLYGIPCSGMRFFTVYGPWGRPDMAYYAFTKAILECRPIDVFNHAHAARFHIRRRRDRGARALGRPSTARRFERGCAHDLQCRQPHARRARALHRRHRNGIGTQGGQALPADAAGRRARDLGRRRTTGARDRLCAEDLH